MPGGPILFKLGGEGFLHLLTDIDGHFGCVQWVSGDCKEPGRVVPQGLEFPCGAESRVVAHNGGKRLHGTLHGRILFPPVPGDLGAAEDGGAVHFVRVCLDVMEKGIASFLVPHLHYGEVSQALLGLKSSGALEFVSHRPCCEFPSHDHGLSWMRGSP